MTFYLMQLAKVFYSLKGDLLIVFDNSEQAAAHHNLFPLNQWQLVCFGEFNNAYQLRKE